MLATDLDGTLLNSERRVGDKDWAALVRLGERGVVRVIATGRSLYSAQKVLPPTLPIDYLVYSSGVGAVSWPDQRALFGVAMDNSLVCEVWQLLCEHNCDFMAQDAAPDTHQFVFFRSGVGDNPDFEHRLELYAPFARERHQPDGGSGSELGLVSQFVIVCATGGVELHAQLKAQLPRCNVVRTTSPLDGQSVWIEVFPSEVSKASGCAWITSQHAIDVNKTVGIGNDFNDLDLLNWVGSPFVVANSPAEMRAIYPVVASNDANGLSAAVALWEAASGVV